MNTIINLIGPGKLGLFYFRLFECIYYLFINGHKYYFNPVGYAVTGWQDIESKWYYFEPRVGHVLECALYVSDQEGALRIGEFRE